MKKIKTTQRAVYSIDGKSYKHFGIHNTTASLYGDKPEDIVEIEMITSDNQEKPPANENNRNTDYWGWFDFDKKDFTMIYPKYFLLNMCFPYGIKTDEDRNIGKAYRLEIIKNKTK